MDQGNLFGSALDSILTSLVLAGPVLVSNPFLTWVAQTAEWSVMRVDLTLMAKNRNPIKAIWRIWIVMGMCSLQSITNGQYEATRAQDLNKVQSMMLVILSQTLKAVIPVNINQFISLFKDTMPVALFGIGRAALGKPDWLETHCEVFFFIGTLFRVMSYTLSYGSGKNKPSTPTIPTKTSPCPSNTRTFEHGRPRGYRS